MAIELVRWEGVGPANTESLLRELQATGRRYSVWANAPGDTYGVHAHSFRKHLVCLSGSIVFTLPATNEEASLAPGDQLTLPPNTAHGAVVGPHGVRCAEAHL